MIFQNRTFIILSLPTKITKNYSSFQKESKVNKKNSMYLQIILTLFFTDYEWKSNLRLMRILFYNPTFDRITKDRAAKFVEKLSAIGGTMGLLTGFSIISGVEIIYFTWKIILNLVVYNKQHALLSTRNYYVHNRY